MNHVIFNGTDLTTFGLYVSGDKTFNAPEKNYTKVSIPGRSGDLFIWDGTYKNVDLKYDSILINNFETNAASLRNYLLSQEGYVRLEDDYHPNEFRMAVYTGPLEFKPVRLLAGKATLEFNCRPERFIKSGELFTAMTDTTLVFTNPTPNPSHPLIKITSFNSDVTFTYWDNTMVDPTYGPQGKNFTVGSWLNPEDLYIDFETLECYDSVGDKQNQQLTFDFDNPLPVIPGNGSLTLLVSSSYSSVSVAPRWYLL